MRKMGYFKKIKHEKVGRFKKLKFNKIIFQNLFGAFHDISHISNNK